MGGGASGQGAKSYLPVLLFGCAILVISTGVRSMTRCTCSIDSTRGSTARTMPNCSR